MSNELNEELKNKISALVKSEAVERLKQQDKEVTTNISLWADGKELPDKDQEPDFETLSPDEKQKKVEADIEKWSKLKLPGYL